MVEERFNRFFQPPPPAQEEEAAQAAGPAVVVIDTLPAEGVGVDLREAMLEMPLMPLPRTEVCLGVACRPQLAASSLGFFAFLIFVPLSSCSAKLFPS